jgi:uncharacterized protein (DUF302 family)
LAGGAAGARLRSATTHLHDAPGVVTKPSARTVDQIVARLKELCEEKRLTLFAIVDHSGEAQRVGLIMPNTKLVIFGSPTAGTPVMLAAPLTALDLPLKILVWEDHSGSVSVSYNAPTYLADRYRLPDELRAPLDAIEHIANAASADA